MARYRRVNIDGQSLYKTETLAIRSLLLPAQSSTVTSTPTRRAAHIIFAG